MSIDPPQLAFVCDLVYRRSAIVLTPEKEYLVESRLGPVARALGYGTVDALITALRKSPVGSLQKSVVEAMTTHETTFFRDKHPFDSLRDSLLPALRKARSTTRALTIFSAACSSGQEPYSIAMLLREHMPDLASWLGRILGADLSDAVLARAREGRYTQSEVSRGLPAPLLVKYFDRVGTEWQIKKCIRDMVELRQMNLVEPWPAIPPVDVLFIRNVLIYFDVPTKKAILQSVRQNLARHAYLVLGGAETTLNIDDAFERVPGCPSTVFQRAAAK